MTERSNIPVMRRRVRSSNRFPHFSTRTWRGLRQSRTDAADAYAHYRAILGPLGVMDGLAVTQRVELVALVARLHWEVTDSQTERYFGKEFNRVRRNSQSAARIVKSKLNKVTAALDDLASYLAPTEPELFGYYMRNYPPDGRDPVATTADIRADADRYRRMQPSDPTEVKRQVAEILWDARKPPTRKQMLVLFTVELTRWFSARFPKIEADIRTASIAKQLLGDNTAVQPHYLDPARGRSAETVRSRRRRAVVKAKRQ